MADGNRQSKKCEWMRLRRKNFLGVGLLILLGCVVLLLPRGGSKRELEAYKKELRARGEKVAIAELVPPHPKGTNGAYIFMGATNLFISLSNVPPMMKMIE